jgi:glucose/arabinose dehydrogenase
VTKDSYGSDPVLPKPKPTLIPTINIAEAKGWTGGATPKPAKGLTVDAFAGGLDHPRWMHLLPNGDVLVAETNAPAKKDNGFNLRKIFMAQAMKRAGAATKSANRIALLRDTDGVGVADLRTSFIDGLISPFGMALLNGKLYIANTDAIVAYPYSRCAHRFVGAHFRPGLFASVAIPQRRVRWPARLMESKRAQRLQSDLRAVPQRQACRSAERHPNRLHRRRLQGHGPPGRCNLRQDGALLVADDFGNVIWRVTPADRRK